MPAMPAIRLSPSAVYFLLLPPASTMASPNANAGRACPTPTNISPDRCNYAEVSVDFLREVREERIRHLMKQFLEEALEGEECGKEGVKDGKREGGKAGVKPKDSKKAKSTDGGADSSKRSTQGGQKAAAEKLPAHLRLLRLIVKKVPVPSARSVD